MFTSVCNSLSVLALCGGLLLPAKPSFSQQPPSGPEGHHDVRGLVVLRISEQLLDRTLASDINKQGQVDMWVLGVRARGPSHTVGTSDVDPKPDRDNAAFRVVVEGHSHSNTSGQKGPAIIHSRSHTEWTVRKNIVFEEGRFVTQPGEIESNTTLTPAGTGATVRGLRGKLVQRIASKKVSESRRCAEASINRQTSAQVLADVDASIDAKIDDLNSAIDSNGVLRNLLPLLDSAVVNISTNDSCIHLAMFGSEAASGTICPLDRLDPAESEVWINSSLLPVSSVDLPDTGLPEVAEDWVNKQLAQLPAPELPLPTKTKASDQRSSSTTIQIVDDWIVLRAEGKATSPDNQVTAEQVAEP